MNNLMIDLETMGKNLTRLLSPSVLCSSIRKVVKLDLSSIPPLALKAQWNKVPFLMAIPFYGG